MVRKHHKNFILSKQLCLSKQLVRKLNDLEMQSGRETFMTKHVQYIDEEGELVWHTTLKNIKEVTNKNFFNFY